MNVYTDKKRLKTSLIEEHLNRLLQNEAYIWLSITKPGSNWLISKLTMVPVGITKEGTTLYFSQLCNGLQA